ncbi:Uncharacterised protein [Zhongshania aliphaticivorans]|uniref:Metal-dependent hydrolase n=1 Tax=Zhongshania aliphaticivorans TaxID=1470434 RepID=A0A5S9PJM0_9GAMM|nr:metal-dependent hydrolase [Zhongshania aliphaticivorans]CAA0104158.1 Uncharacterised protein [Zhongshania aliphaticivorans]CAA0104330.1 Uncharacterised protein [Zhongshania aliphaticivorans]
MSAIPEHPMDDFPVRNLTFDVNNVEYQDPLWSRTLPEFSMFVNALGVHVPYFERYLVKSLSKAKPYIQDDKLRKDVSAIIGQEAHHARNFVDVNRWLSERYPEVKRLDNEAKQYFTKHAKEDDLKKMLGFTAGYETFTFLGGMIILDNYEKWFADSDPTMRAIWMWHQVEEVEHGSVAFDVYQALYGVDEWYRKYMVSLALMHIASETIRTYLHMSRVEGWWRNPLKGLKKLTFCMTMLGRFVRSALPVFKKGYHPRNHPFVTSEQNEIQVAWRRFHSGGGDVLEIDKNKMAEIMAK